MFCVAAVPRPRFANAPDTVVAPVPPFPSATVPVTFKAVPETLPVTFPATFPVTFPVTFPASGPFNCGAVKAPVRVPPESAKPPRLASAPAAVEAPVPPFPNSTVPVTFEAVPETLPVTLPVTFPVTVPASGPFNCGAVKAPVNVPPESGSPPRLASAPAAVDAPVPPFPSSTVPVTFEAVPETLPVTLPVTFPVTVPASGPFNCGAVKAPVRVPPESAKPPRLARAPAAVDAPVPPFPRSTVPVTFKAVPEAFPVTLPVTLPVTFPVNGPFNCGAVKAPVSVPPESANPPRFASAPVPVEDPVPPAVRGTVLNPPIDVPFAA